MFDIICVSALQDVKGRVTLALHQFTHTVARWNQCIFWSQCFIWRLQTGFFTWSDEKTKFCSHAFDLKNTLLKKKCVCNSPSLCSGSRASRHLLKVMVRVNTPRLQTRIFCDGLVPTNSSQSQFCVKLQRRQSSTPSPRVSARSCNACLSSLCTSVGHIADNCKQREAKEASMHQHFLRHSLCTRFGQRKSIQEDSSRVSSKYVNAGTAFGA